MKELLITNKVQMRSNVGGNGIRLIATSEFFSTFFVFETGKIKSEKVIKKKGEEVDELEESAFENLLSFFSGNNGKDEVISIFDFFRSDFVLEKDINKRKRSVFFGYFIEKVDNSLFGQWRRSNEFIDLMFLQMFAITAQEGKREQSETWKKEEEK